MTERTRKFSRAVLLLACVQSLFNVVYSDCDGKCVPRAECEDYGGIGIVDLRFGNDCDHYLEVCCPEESVISSTPAPPITPTKQEPTEFAQCGIRNKDGVGYRITNANSGETEFGEFPWMVALFTQDRLDIGEIDKTYFCGGSLISPNIVMTAAHCVINRTSDSLIARVGDWDMKTVYETLPYQEQPVSTVIIHEKYDKLFMFNNIALLVLEEPFTPDENVQLLCLPPQNNFFDDEEECFATGWGKDRFDSASNQAILKKVKLPIVSHDSCQAALRATRLGRSFRLHNSNICAGGEAGVDTCTGDGGSPLVCPIAGKVDQYHQVGIVAWGIGCGQQGIPGVYVKNSLYTKWIENKIRELGV